MVTTSSPALEIEAELRDLQRLAGVAGDGELLRVAAELRGQPPAHALDVRLEHLPHVVHGRLVRDVEVALQRLVHDARARTAAAVVEVDDGAVERERLLDLAPVVLVGRDRFGGVAFTAAPAARAARHCRRGTTPRARPAAGGLENWRLDNITSSLV